MSPRAAIASVTASWASIADARPECACGCGRDVAREGDVAERCAELALDAAAEATECELGALGGAL